MKQNRNKLDNWRTTSYDDHEFNGDLVELKEFTVFEQDRETFTGLYDADGKPIHRMRQKMGFI